MKNDRLSAKSEIEKLVRYFEQNIYQLKSQSFNETQARQQLIDPLFEALGWDVHNRSMKPLYLQEVVPEGRVKTNLSKEVKEQEVLFETKSTLGKTHREYASILDYIAEDNYKASSKEAIKKPDYRFRIKGQTKFFVEAKKPFVDLSKSMEAIFQVKRYGFSGRVPVSILTDFEEFRTFDCTHKPQFDKPKLGIIKEFDLRYEQYLEEFDRLYDTFSREAVESGSLETLTRKLLRKKTGDFALDKHFLEDLSKWRVELARDIAKHPRNRRRLNDYTLNESVQRILDRIVFFRVCEDREIEVENTLLAILQMWQGRQGISIYSLLNELFKQRRALYNGLLFAPHECEELDVGNEVLLKILEGLNYPFSPYYFNEIGVEILGSIYEKFLGKTIHLTPKTVRVDEKPEVRKAGGVYYTPQYIVNYIVENTLGKLLYEEGQQSPLLLGEGQGEVSKKQTPSQPSPKRGRGNGSRLKLSPKQVAKLKIIDIACGSGSFLLGAFQKLIDYHVQWYHSHPKDIQTVNNAPDAYKDATGNLHLSPRKKRDILVNNIYGVDIDRQAVEVTQMSLYLKVLEGENAGTLNPQMTLALKEVYLPALTDNIKCGNSLIGTDFFVQGTLFDEEMQHKVNPFDWEMEFPEIFKSPLLSGEGKGEVGGFDCVIGNPPYVTVDILTSEIKDYIFRTYKTATGRTNLFVGFLEKGCSLLNPGGLMCYIIPRNYIKMNSYHLSRKMLRDKVHLSMVTDCGPNVFEGVTAETVILGIEKPKRDSISRMTTVLRRTDQNTFDQLNDVESQSVFKDDEATINISTSDSEAALFEKMKVVAEPISMFIDVINGIATGDDKMFVHPKKINRECEKVIKGRDIARYSVTWGGEWVWFNKEEMMRNNGRVASPKWREMFEVDEKIVMQRISENIKAALDTDSLFVINSAHCLLKKESTKQDLKYFLALLNSRLLGFYYQRVVNQGSKQTTIVSVSFVNKLPIRTIDFTNPAEKRVHDSLVALVEKMLELHKQLQKASFDSEKEPIQRQIAATDKKIDQLVYKLYGLTEEEIKIVDGG